MEMTIKNESRPGSSASGGECCHSCHLVLRDPHIVCCDCPDVTTKICLECFAKGSKFASHLETHRYRVVNAAFSVLEPSWTAEEETVLLNLLLTRGQGSWEDIAKGLQGSKTAEQCAEHFQKQYVDNSSGLLSDYWKERAKSIRAQRRDQPVSLVCPTDFPPRPLAGSAAHKDLAGYNPARGDFDSELFNTAELDIVHVDAEAVKEGYECRERLCSMEEDDEEPPSDADLDAMLQMSSMEVYNDRLRERQRIKRLVRELGLLNKSRELSATSRQDHLALMGGPPYGKLRKFSRLLCSFDFDYLLEGLRHEFTLRQSIEHLQDFRQNGLTRTDSTAFFAKLKRQRDNSLRELPTDGVRDWVRSGCFPRAVDPASTALPSTMLATRRSAPPLDLVGLPGVSRLTEEEKELCSRARVQPEMFFEVSAAMVRECKSKGGLKLAEARPLAKMDVNKTRKLYDFLIARGDIHKPE